MSSIKVQSNVSGSGTLQIAAPNTNTDRTLTLPDESGTVLTDTSGVKKSGDTLTGSLIGPDLVGTNGVQGVTGTGNYGVRVIAKTNNSVATLQFTDNPVVNEWATLNAYSSGAITMPKQPMFRAQGSNSKAYVAGERIQMTSAFDIGSNWSNPNYGFYAPVAGTYFFGANFYVWSGSGASIQSIAVRVNNTEVSTGDTMIWFQGGNGYDHGDQQVRGTTALQLAAGDLVTFHVRTGAPTINIYAGHTWVHGHLIG